MAEVDTQTAKAPNNTKKLIILMLVAVLVVGSVGVGVGYFVAGSHAAVDANEDAGAAAKAGKNSKKKKPTGPAIYHKIDPALVVNFQANGVIRFLQVQIETLTRDPATAEALQLHEPAIRNDLLMLLGSQTLETVTTKEGKEQIRAQALEVVRNVIEREGGDGELVENVFFTSFVMQ
jgi:flagellar FliL protein